MNVFSKLNSEKLKVNLGLTVSGFFKGQIETVFITT